MLAFILSLVLFLSPNYNTGIYSFERNLGYRFPIPSLWGPDIKTDANLFRSLNGVFRSSNGNYYVLVYPPFNATPWQIGNLLFPEGVALVCIDPVGRIRWDVIPHWNPNFYSLSDKQAIIYFGLSLPKRNYHNRI